MSTDELKAELAANISDIVKRAISASDYPPYAYMYPPRTSFHYLGDQIDTMTQWGKEYPGINNMGLYVHIPFCRTICSFCNLFTTAVPSMLTVQKYIRAVQSEMIRMSALCRSYKVSSIYLGGGTPSLLPIEHIKDLCSTIRESFQLNESTEFAIEANPQDVSVDWAIRLKEIGFERVNLGTQTFDNSELNSINRSYETNTNVGAVRFLKNAGIKNVSIDLIYGLPYQTAIKWEESVKMAISEEPDTISLYSLSRRPNTRFGKDNSDNFISYKERYRLYDKARRIIIERGFRQVTNVRFTSLTRNSYKQQQDHWRSIPIMGVGCGAQTYGVEWDYITCSDFNNKRHAIQRYIETNGSTQKNVVRGYHMTFAERIRRYAILSLHNLSFSHFYELFNLNAINLLYPWLNTFSTLNLGKIDINNFILNSKGFKFRDILCRTMFSEKAIELENAPKKLFYDQPVDYTSIARRSDVYINMILGNTTLTAAEN